MVLVGTVQRDRGRLRVTARLVNTADGFTIWSDMFERESKDVFKMQDEISSAIVSAISPELSGSVGGPSAPAPAAPNTVAVARAPLSTAARGTADLQAYDLYLRGRFFFDKRGETSLRRALDYFEQAAKKDTTFARPYAGIANVYALLPLYANVRSDSVMPLALAAINRAVSLDSTLSEAFASRAALLQSNWQWAEAEHDYERSLRLDPNSAQAHQWYGEILLLDGRAPLAQTQLKRATELDPLSPIIFGSYGLVLAAARQPDAAVAAARRAVELDSTLLVSRFMLGTVYLQANRLAEATKELENAARLDATSVPTMGLLGYAYAKAGNTARATELARGLEASIGKKAGAAAAAARVYLGLGDKNRALTLLERAAAIHDPFFSSESMLETFFDPVRADPRFDALVSRVGLSKRLLSR
jgi:serine/threonine-protein kinase